MRMRRVVAGVVLLATATFVAGQPSEGGPFKLTRMTIDNGGGESQGGGFRLRATIGQHDASTQTASGGAFKVTGGFWASGNLLPPGDLLFSDSFEDI